MNILHRIISILSKHKVNFPSNTNMGFLKFILSPFPNLNHLIFLVYSYITVQLLTAHFVKQFLIKRALLQFNRLFAYCCISSNLMLFLYSVNKFSKILSYSAMPFLHFQTYFDCVYLKKQYVIILYRRYSYL